MTMAVSAAKFTRTLLAARHRLLAERAAGGHWEGELSASALATATAVTALATVDPGRYAALVRSGLAWLAQHQNDDGGWGDTVASASNIATTLLAWSAFAATRADAQSDVAGTLARAEQWIAGAAGGLDAARIARAVDARYGNDRTFSAPILTMGALAGRLGTHADPWQYVYPLPFELAALPHWLLKWLRLPVVSYALPALIAIGQVRHHFRPTRNPVGRLLRRLTREKTLRVLAEIQPPSGGFLEATPLTSFVTMSLAAAGRRDHPAAARGIGFLVASVRADGSWPIDTNLATWVTTLALSALAAGPGFAGEMPAAERERLRQWLLDQQHLVRHLYTYADPGGWAWTDLAGGVPDADDTAGALVALRHLGPLDGPARRAGAAGVTWLLDLQNRDGGIPTFCRGWGALPFDRSSPDLTAHALQAWASWLGDLAPAQAHRVMTASGRALAYLERAQSPDGSWTPLWFGNQYAPNEESPTYGTARVVAALGRFAREGEPRVEAMMERGAAWLLSAQGGDGGWGGAPATPASIEETALALDALAGLCADPPLLSQEAARAAIARGVAWLVEHTAEGTRFEPAPIGFYFAKLWYSERLYPVIFTVSALERVRRAGLAPA
jgi:squalene-hopene/tetraprenyl-beta-curcumene cyclase